VVNKDGEPVEESETKVVEPETTVAELVEGKPPAGDGTIRLSDLIYEGKPLEVKGTIYHVKHALQLNLLDTARSDKNARIFNALMPRFRGGELNEEEASQLEEALTNFAEAVTDVPREILAELPWWQRVMIIGLFQQRQSPKAEAVPTENRQTRRSRKPISRAG
jgi:hypothetical protein